MALFTRAGTVAAIVEGGGVAAAPSADVGNEFDCAAAITLLADELGPPTALVNNAGVGPPGGIEDVSAEVWDRTIAVNLRGQFLLARAVVPYMGDRDRGESSTSRAFRQAVRMSASRMQAQRHGK